MQRLHDMWLVGCFITYLCTFFVLVIIAQFRHNDIRINARQPRIKYLMKKKLTQMQNKLRIKTTSNVGKPRVEYSLKEN